MRLIPRSEKFFTYFLEQVKVICESAGTLHEAAKQGYAALASAEKTVQKLEQRGDEIIHEVFTRLNSTFITPLDPEDIHSLASHLDDVTDGIEETMHRLVAYKVDPIPPQMVELTSIIVSCGHSLLKAFEALSEEKPLLEHCIEINRLEGQADDVVRGAIARLFQEEKDPIQLIKLKEVYEVIEKTTDFCEDVADVLQGVVVKNS